MADHCNINGVILRAEKSSKSTGLQSLYPITDQIVTDNLLIFVKMLFKTHFIIVILLKMWKKNLNFLTRTGDKVF
jgi:hypothetical protein